MLEMRRPHQWSEPEKKPRPTHPDNVKPRTDAYTEAQRLKRGHGFIPSEFRPQDELDEEERTKAPKTFVPIEEFPDTTTMNPEEALLAKEEAGAMKDEPSAILLSKKKASHISRPADLMIDHSIKGKEAEYPEESLKIEEALDKQPVISASEKMRKKLSLEERDIRRSSGLRKYFGHKGRGPEQKPKYKTEHEKRKIVNG